MGRNNPQMGPAACNSDLVRAPMWAPNTGWKTKERQWGEKSQEREKILAGNETHSVPHVLSNGASLIKKLKRTFFVGCSYISKGYEDFIRRDVKVDEDAYWNSNISQVRRIDVQPALEDSNEDLEAQNDKDFFVRRTRTFAKICGRCNLVFPKPSNFQDAGGIEEWMRGMKEEIAMIEKNKTWKLIDKLERKQKVFIRRDVKVDEESYCDLNISQVRRMDIEPALEDSNKDFEANDDEDFYVRGSRSLAKIMEDVYVEKFHAYESINKSKEYLVVKVYSQKPGVDYLDSSAPVARMNAISILIALATQMMWKILYLDVKSAFRNGFLEDEIY
ncbi:uncharacterized protein LOC125834275 [Solanum verrucosum]|uniref:uncharacterized protein LOC125834275 n=1 Tax=Solanum verrucosum TaxID=315347 RepID=UPI0020D1C589|nr:uncharacterized protein LOC125834275 [Solanum verrucosum]